jgi:hypothetical protein
VDFFSGYGGNHRVLLTGATHDIGNWLFYPSAQSSAAHCGVDQRGLVTPVNLGAFKAGALFDSKVSIF